MYKFEDVITAFKKIATYTYRDIEVEGKSFRISTIVVDTETSYVDKIKKCEELGYLGN